MAGRASINEDTSIIDDGSSEKRNVCNSDSDNFRKYKSLFEGDSGVLTCDLPSS